MVRWETGDVETVPVSEQERIRGQTWSTFQVSDTFCSEFFMCSVGKGLPTFCTKGLL